MPDRSSEFSSVRETFPGREIVSSHDRFLALEGDSLELLGRLPDDSVSLIVTDPPYHSTRKSNIIGDTSFAEDDDFVDWLAAYAAEWRRVLKLSGTAYMFCSSEMAARLEVSMAEYLRPIARITWSKPNEPGYDGWKGKARKSALRTWYPHSERILVFEQGGYGTPEAYRRTPMGEYLLAMRTKAGMTMVELTEAIGAYGRVNRGGAVANWEAGRNIPSREQYSRLSEALEQTGRVESMLPYEDVVRPMHLRADAEFTDVWDFPSVRPYEGKHPAEKPTDMLQHIVTASSYPDDVVLDCFAGSGSTGRAALLAGRRAITMEIDPGWARSAGEVMSSTIRLSSELAAS